MVPSLGVLFFHCFQIQHFKFKTLARLWRGCVSLLCLFLAPSPVPLRLYSFRPLLSEALPVAALQGSLFPLPFPVGVSVLVSVSVATVCPENKASHPKWRTSTQSPPWMLVKCAGTQNVPVKQDRGNYILQGIPWAEAQAAAMRCDDVGFQVAAA